MALTMTTAQFELVSQHFKNEFVEKVFQYLNKTIEDKTFLSDETLAKEIINDLVLEAEGFSIVEEADIYQYIEFIFSNPEFQERPYDQEVLEILKWKVEDFQWKMNWLQARIKS